MTEPGGCRVYPPHEAWMVYMEPIVLAVFAVIVAGAIWFLRRS